MEHLDAKLNALFDLLLRWAIAPVAVLRPPMTIDDFADYVSYLRALMRHEGRTRSACERAVKRLIATGKMPDDIETWERYFLDLRLQAALSFLAECNNLTRSGVRVHCELPDSREKALETLLSVLWRNNFCEHFLKLASVSNYFKISFQGADDSP